MCQTNENSAGDAGFQEPSFETFWDKFIKKTTLMALEEIDDDFKQVCGMKFAYKSLDEYKNLLDAMYHEKREWLKKVYLPHDDDPKLDMHKLGAILCRCILAHKPFYFDFDKAEQYVLKRFSKDKSNHIDWFVRNIYANYRVAFYAATGMAYTNLLMGYSEKGLEPNEDAYQYFERRQGVLYYPQSPLHDSYENSCVIALQKNDVAGRRFDYLGFATNLFQLEEYNKKHYFCRQKERELKIAHEEIARLKMLLQQRDVAMA